VAADPSKVQAWREAAQDLDIEVVEPFQVGEIECIAYLPQFSQPRGAVVFDHSTTTLAQARSVEVEGYGWTLLSWVEYDRALFVEALAEWGWSAATDPPGWYVEEVRRG
jgi:hypothetical protein